MGDQEQKVKPEQSEEPGHAARQIIITRFKDDSTQVIGFPPNIREAIEDFTLGILAVAEYFINAAIDGRLKRSEKFVAPEMNEVSKLN